MSLTTPSPRPVCQCEAEHAIVLHLPPELQSRLREIVQCDEEFTVESVILDAIEQFLDGTECDPDAPAWPTSPRNSLPLHRIKWMTDHYLDGTPVVVTRKGVPHVVR